MVEILALKTGLVIVVTEWRELDVKIIFNF